MEIFAVQMFTLIGVLQQGSVQPCSIMWSWPKEGST